jgi:cytochrome P450
MVAYTEQALQSWISGVEVDIGRELNRLTMRIVGKILFDVDVFDESDALGAAITLALRHVVHGIFDFFPIPLRWPTAQNRRTQAAILLIQERLQGMIDERRRQPMTRSDFLSLLLQTQDEQGAGMSDEQARDEAITLFIAGHETTANALAWCFFLLARHPVVYDRMQQEVDRELQGRSPTVADLPRLPFALQVVKETLRLYPPGWLLNRQALRPVTVGGWPLAKGQAVMIAVYTLHRRPDYFPDPTRFNPDRFVPENEQKLPRYAYLPFGAGPRICIGNHFAMMEAHLILVTLVQRMTFAWVPGQQIVPAGLMTLQQRPSCRLVTHRR